MYYPLGYIVLFLLTVHTFGAYGQNIEDNQNAIQRHRNAAKQIESVTKKYEALNYVNAKNDTLLYRLLEPLNYEPNKKYPLVVCLSGSGGRGNDNIRQLSSGWAAQVLSNESMREDFPCFVFAPQCPTDYNFGISLSFDINPSKVLPSIESLVFEVIEELQKMYNIDADRLYITGQSMGGFGTWHYILNYPKMFAAAVPVCGGGNTDLAYEIKDLPVWAFHGENDTAVPVDLSRTMIKAIEKSGGHPKYTELKNVAHICWPLAYDTPELFNWLFKQKRQN